jgi:hypothetical protein
MFLISNHGSLIVMKNELQLEIKTKLFASSIHNSLTKQH